MPFFALLSPCLSACLSPFFLTFLFILSLSVYTSNSYLSLLLTLCHFSFLSSPLVHLDFDVFKFQRRRLEYWILRRPGKALVLSWGYFTTRWKSVDMAEGLRSCSKLMSTVNQLIFRKFLVTVVNMTWPCFFVFTKVMNLLVIVLVNYVWLLCFSWWSPSNQCQAIVLLVVVSLQNGPQLSLLHCKLLFFFQLPWHCACCRWHALSLH